MIVSSTGNPSDTDQRVDIDTHTRTFPLHGHPEILYTATIVRAAGDDTDSWALAEVTLRSLGAPLRQADFPPLDRLIRAVLGEPLTPVQSLDSVTAALAVLPMRYRHALHLAGINTPAQLQQLTHDQLLDVPGIGVTGARAISAALADHTAHFPIDLDSTA